MHNVVTILQHAFPQIGRSAEAVGSLVDVHRHIKGPLAPLAVGAVHPVVAHVDVQRPLRPAQLLSKRVAGAVNLHLLGRASHFTWAAQAALVASVEAAAPDAILCSGDLTALATPQEFEAAHELIAPIFEACPTALVAGNHDTYTRAAWKGRQLEEHFGRWMWRKWGVQEEIEDSEGEVDMGELARWQGD